MSIFGMATQKTNLIKVGESKLANDLTKGENKGAYANASAVARFRSTIPLVKDLSIIETEEQANGLEAIAAGLEVQTKAIKRGGKALEKISELDAEIRESEVEYHAKHAKGIEKQINHGVKLFDVVNGQRIHQRDTQNHITAGLNTVNQVLSRKTQLVEDMGDFC